MQLEKLMACAAKVICDIQIFINLCENAYGHHPLLRCIFHLCKKIQSIYQEIPHTLKNTQIIFITQF